MSNSTSPLWELKSWDAVVTEVKSSPNIFFKLSLRPVPPQAKAAFRVVTLDKSP